MEIVLDVKIDVKSSSYRDVITDFGYFKKITGESNQNISYIRNATNAEFSIKPFYSGISDGLTIALKHNTLDGVNNAKRLLLSLLDTMKDDFEVFKINRGIPMEAVNIVVELNLAVCGETGFMSTSFLEFEDHVSKVSKDHGSGREKPKKTPWGTPHSETRTTTGGMKSGGQSSLSGARAQAYSSDSPAMNRSSTWSKAPNKSSFEGKTVTTRPSYGTAEKRSTLGVTASRSAAGAATGRSNLGFVAKRPIPSLTARRSALGFAASRYATATKRPTFSLAAKRSAVGGPAAASRLATARRPATPGTGGVKQPKSIYALPSENKSRYESTFGTGNKRGAQSVANEFGSNKRQKTSRFDNNVPTSKPASRGDSENERKKQDTSLSREQNLLARRLRKDLSDNETKVAIQQLKNKLTTKEVKLVFQQIEETEKREKLPTQSDYTTLQLKVLVGAINRKNEGFGITNKGTLQTISSVKVETNRVLQLLKKNQVSDKTVQNLIDKYVEHYKLNRNEKNTIDQKIRVECSTIQKQTGVYPDAHQKSVIQFRNLQKALVEKVELSGSVYVDFDAFTYINTFKEANTMSRRTAQKQDRSPPDPERMVAVRLSLEAMLRRREAEVIPNQVAEKMCKQLIAAVAAGAQTEMSLRNTWERLVERKRFEERREPKQATKVTIMLDTVVKYIKKQLEARNISNEAMESIMDVLKPQPKPTDPEEPSTNIPIFPVLEKPHATERSVETRLHWLIAEIGFILNKRKTGQMPDQEVEMMVARIKNGVPPIYYDVVHGRFQETARDIERMAGRPMSPSRNLTCQLQVICTYARHYLLDKLPGGSPLDPAQHRNPFQYIDYSMDEKSKEQKVVKPLMEQPVFSPQKITDIPSLIGFMDSSAAKEEKQRILELREYAKEARIGVASMGVRRVEKIENDLMIKMPNKFKNDLEEHKKEVEEKKGRVLTARERLEATIVWILKSVHASGDGPKATLATLKKSTMPAIVRMRGAEVLKRETLKLWNKLKTGKPQINEVSKQLKILRSRLTRNEGDALRKEYDREILKLCKKHKVTRLPDSVATVTKFEVTLKYVMGDESPISKESVANEVARKFYDAMKGGKNGATKAAASPAKAKQSPIKRFAPKTNTKSPRANQNGALSSDNKEKQQEESDDDVVIVDDVAERNRNTDLRITVLRNKFNTIARQFKQGRVVNTDKMAEIIALMKTNLYLTCDDEDELFAEVRCAWEDNGGDDLSEKKKLAVEFNLTVKRVLAKVEELIEKEGDITVADVKERLSCIMAGKMVDV